MASRSGARSTSSAPALSLTAGLAPWSLHVSSPFCLLRTARTGASTRGPLGCRTTTGGLTALRRRWPLFDLRARKVSGQRSGLEAHGARPVRAAGWARWRRRGRVRAQRRGGGGALAFALVCVGQSSAFGGGKKLAREAARGCGPGGGTGRRGYGYTVASRPAPLSTQFPLAPLSFTRAL